MASRTVEAAVVRTRRTRQEAAERPVAQARVLAALFRTAREQAAQLREQLGEAAQRREVLA